MTDSRATTEGSPTRDAALAAELAATRKLAALGALATPFAEELGELFVAIGTTGEAWLGAADPDVREGGASLVALASRGKAIVELYQRCARQKSAPRAQLDLARVVSEAVALLRVTIPTEVNIRVALLPLREQVLADEMAVHQLLISLIGGSAERSDAGTTLAVSVQAVDLGEARNVACSELPSGRYVELCVEGGEAGRQRPSGPASGFGFELAVVKSTVEAHGGAVVVEGSADVGWRVACLFPVIETTRLL